MDLIYSSESRLGNFTSSGIAALIKGGQTAETYVAEKIMEREFDLPLEPKTDTRETLWGKLVERRCFDILGLEYKLSSQETLTHSIIKYWRGSPDGFKYDEGQTIIDIKSPATRKSFHTLTYPLYHNTSILPVTYLRAYHKSGETYYWQLVSNACISKSKYAELIVYMPYREELDIIREMAKATNDAAYNWIYYAEDYQLPYIKDGGRFKNLNIIRFEVSEADKLLLTDKVVEYGKKLLAK